jgi:hypothetical protein
MQQTRFSQVSHPLLISSWTKTIRLQGLSLVWQAVILLLVIELESVAVQTGTNEPSGQEGKRLYGTEPG